MRPRGLFWLFIGKSPMGEEGDSEYELLEEDREFWSEREVFK